MSGKKTILTMLIFLSALPLFTCQKYDDGKWYMRNFWKRQMTGEFDITSISIDGKEYIEEYAKLYGAKPRAVITKGRYGKPRGGWYPNMEDDFEVTLKVEYFHDKIKVAFFYWRPEPEKFPDSIYSSDGEIEYPYVNSDSLFIRFNTIGLTRYILLSSQNKGFSIRSNWIMEKKDSLVFFNKTKNCEIHFKKVR